MRWPFYPIIFALIPFLYVAVKKPVANWAFLCVDVWIVSLIFWGMAVGVVIGKLCF